MRLITLAADHAPRSGYSALADYMTDSERLTTRRLEPKGFLERVAVGVLSRLSFTRWYAWGSAELEWKALRRLRNFKGIIHMLWADRDLGFIDLLRDKKRHRFCATFHGDPDTLSKSVHFPSRLHGFDAIIIVSEVQRKFFEAHGISSNRIHLVRHGVDTKFFRPPSKRPTDAFFNVLSVGGYRRNFTFLSDICRLMLNQSLVRFNIVAPPAFRALFAGLANVNFVSHLTDEQLLDAYQKASCFLLTAECATANNALLEAMACGLPVVAEAIGGIPEYVGPDSAVLITPNLAESFAQVISGLAQSPIECMRLGTNARLRAKELDWPLVAARTRDIYCAIA